MKYVIIGNGIAATSAIESIRIYDSTGELVVISDEKYANYSRPLISYLLGNKIEQNKMNFKPEDFYTENKVTCLLDKKVVHVDTENKLVRLASKETISYDKLLITSGGTPIIPNDIKGVDLDNVFTFTKLDDAIKINKYIIDHDVQNAVVIGGGLIGLKATEALLLRKLKVTLVELADRILSLTFDKKASSIIESELQKNGCQLELNNTVTEIKKSEVILKTGQVIKTGLVIMAIGVRPNTDFLKTSGIKINRGIITNKFMQTNVKDVFAAGDVVETDDFFTGKQRVVAIWPNAAKQGHISGINMAGGDDQETFDTGSIAMNSVELCDIPTISAGLTEFIGSDQYEIIEVTDIKHRIYKKLVLEDNKIIGLVFVNDIDRAGIYVGLLKEKVDVTSFKSQLLKDSFGLISLPDDYRKHLVEGPGIEI
jgi:NAD(P)H-nitrite reductase large subunit